MQSNQSLAVNVFESPTDNERIEVVLEQNEDTLQIVLRYSTWTDGLGWCSQKTIRVSSDHLDDLHHAITVARHRINRSRAEAGRVVQSNNVIQLPTLS